MKTHRVLQSKLEKKQFSAYKGKLAYGGGKRNNTSKKDTKYSNPRDNITLHPLSKLNILPLIETGPFPRSAEFYEVAARLIRLLYQKASIYQPDLEYKVLDLLIEEAKKEEKLSIETLTAAILQIDKSLYKIFKGTKKYTVLTNSGYPPLFDFITIETVKTKKPIHFHYATTPIILALFGNDVTVAIQKKEEEKWGKDQKHHTLAPQELEPLLLQERAKGNLQGIEFFIDFSQKTEANPNITVTDSASGITLKSKI